MHLLLTRPSRVPSCGALGCLLDGEGLTAYRELAGAWAAGGVCRDVESNPAVTTAAR